MLLGSAFASRGATTDSSTSSYVITHSILLQTSLGPLVADLYGADFPAATAHFVNLARAQLFQGAAVTAVVPDHALIFSQDLLFPESSLTSNSANPGEGKPIAHCPECPPEQDQRAAHSTTRSPYNFFSLAAAASDAGAAGYYHMEEERLHQALQKEFGMCKQQRMRLVVPVAPHAKKKSATPTPATAESEAASGAAATGSLCRKHLLFVPMSTSSSSINVSTHTGKPWPLLDYFGITLMDRSSHALESTHIAIGELRDVGDMAGGITAVRPAVLPQLRRQPYRQRPARLQQQQGGTTPSLINLPQPSPYDRWAVPLRMLRILDCTPLPIGGSIPLWEVRAALGERGGGGGPAHTGALAMHISSVLHALGCWRFTASTEAVRDANRWVTHVFLAPGLHPGAAVPPPPLASEEEKTAPPLLFHRPAELDHELFSKSAASQEEGVQKDDVAVEQHLRERRLCTLLVEPGIQRIVPNLLSTGPLLPPEGEGHATSSSLAARIAGDVQRSANEKKVVDSLALAMQVLEGVPSLTSPSSPGASGSGIQIIEPCERTLFVCRLNPVTTSEGLAECFAPFGPILSCNILKDPHTGASLRYGFIEFSSKENCFAALEKMNNALIDDSRIQVDFSQSIRKAVRQHRRRWAAGGATAVAEDGGGDYKRHKGG